MGPFIRAAAASSTASAWPLAVPSRPVPFYVLPPGHAELLSPRLPAVAFAVAVAAATAAAVARLSSGLDIFAWLSPAHPGLALWTMNLPRLVRSLIAAGIFAAAVIFYASTHPKLSALRGVPWGPHPRPSRHPHSHLHDTFYVPTNSLTLPRGRVIPNGRPAVINQRGNYIRATKLHDGSLLAAYVASEDVPGGRPQLVLHTSRSTDGAVTWQPWGEVQRAGQDDFDLDNAFPFQIPENAPGGGRLLVAYRKHSLRPGANPLSLGKDRYDHYRLGLSVSDDGGQTFEELSTIVESFADKAPDLNGVWEPFLRLARDGHTLQCYFSSENSGVDQDNFMRTSSDGGRTWSRDWVPVSGLNDPSPSRDGMVNVAPLDNRGNLM